MVHAQNNTINLKLKNGEILENVSLKKVRDQSVFLELDQHSKWLLIDSIDSVIVEPRSRILKSAETGGIVGGISGIIGSIIWYIVEKPKEGAFFDGGFMHVFAPFQIACWGYLIGLVVGIGYDIFAQADVHNFIELTQVERIDAIQELIGKQKGVVLIPFQE